MKIAFNIMMIVFLLFVAVLSVSAEDLDKRWKHFATNVAWCNFYYDTESIIYLPNNVAKVWVEMLCPETTGYVVLEMKTLKEIDCNKRTYRQLQMEGTQNDGSDVFNFESSRYDEIEPGTWMETLYHAVCKKKEMRN